jgi:nicotinate-nucleotide pyrophosphorylase (carboxylating)
MQLFISPHIQRLIDLALDEDDLNFDVTSNVFFSGQQATTKLIAKDDIVIAGVPVFLAVFNRVDPNVKWTMHVKDGDVCPKGTLLGECSADAISMLRAERTALNFLQRMSGVATLTHSYVNALGESTTRIVDTRKTLPGYRELDKYSVVMGGGTNHRYSLGGGAMVKDNHIAAAGGVATAIEQVRKQLPHTLKIEVEVERMDQLVAALEAGADIIMLDNMDTPTMRQAVAKIRDFAGDRVAIEASGNITIERLPELADVGLDYISSGALTHSATAADISMKFTFGG